MNIAPPHNEWMNACWIVSNREWKVVGFCCCFVQVTPVSNE